MPTSVIELFEEANLSFDGPQKWGQIIQVNEPGVYVISLSENAADKANCLLKNAPIEQKIVKNWIERVSRLKIDKSLQSTQALVNRLSEFWLPDEPILYIGNTPKRTIAKRVQECYVYVLGDSSQHRGGHWLKTLKILEELYIFWAITKKYEHYKKRLLEIFIDNVSTETKELLYDPFLPLPFANLELSKDRRKNHGISGQTN